MEKAGFGSRFVAYLIDNILVGLIYTIIFSCMIFPGLIFQEGDDALVIVMVCLGCLLGLIGFVIHFVYFGYFWSKRAQTPGKMLLNIEVVKEDGSMMSFFESGLRGTLGYWLSSFVFYLGFLWALFDDNKETWHDKIFSTQVLFKP